MSERERTNWASNLRLQSNSPCINAGLNRFPSAEFLSRCISFSCVQVDECNVASLTAGFATRILQFAAAESQSWSVLGEMAIHQDEAV